MSSKTKKKKIKKGDLVSYGNGVWEVISKKSADQAYGEPLTVFKIKHISGKQVSPSPALASEADIIPLSPLGALGTASIKESPTLINEIVAAASDERSVVTHGRLFIRPKGLFTLNEDGPNETTVQRAIVAGVVLGDIVGAEDNANDKGYPQDELWLCSTIVITPIKRYRGFSKLGSTIDQALLGGGLDPYHFAEEISSLPTRKMAPVRKRAKKETVRKLRGRTRS